MIRMILEILRGEKRHKKQKSSSAEDRFNEVVETYQDLDEPEDEDIVPEFRKDEYELFGNQFISKSEYDYNMDQMTIPMSDDMGWAGEHVLGVDCHCEKAKKRHTNSLSQRKISVTRSESMLDHIRAILNEQRQMQRLEVYVGGRPRTEDIRVFVRPK
ncbi:hypothetical protein Tco_0713812 [Tanacetum coccineum]